MKRLRSNGFTIIELMISLSILSIILLMASVILIDIGKTYSKGVNESNAQNADRTIIGNITASLEFSGQQSTSCTPDKPALPVYDPPLVTTHGPYYQSPVTCYMNTGSETLNGKQHTVYSFCTGNTRYTYTLNAELASADGNNPYNVSHVLWQDTLNNSSAPCAVLDLSANTPSDGNTTPGSGNELMPSHMRLTRFYITPLTAGNTSAFVADVWLAYGDDDLLNVQPKDVFGGAPLTDQCIVGSGNSSNCAGYVGCKGSAGDQYCADSLLSTTITRRVQ